jgi:ribonuclease E
MGISPLVRLNREVKNPKSVILSVVLPGEAAPTETVNQTSAASSIEAPRQYFNDSDEAETPQQDLPNYETDYSDTDEPEISEARESLNWPTQEPAPEISPELTNSFVSDEIPAANRRRRRRSSAMDSD